ncbi:unnamed protein product [Symbiodinium natans]|uniref:Uncharacterized protein n=1 Tax=Symbiodinium natans TaxID=878477 RepID=A0A812M0C2_9DINO|nr:unnamed protein product [Symbiodinium natans]
MGNASSPRAAEAEFQNRIQSQLQEFRDCKIRELKDRIHGLRKDFLDRAQALHQDFRLWRDGRISLFYTVDDDEFRIGDITQLESEFEARAIAIGREFSNSFEGQADASTYAGELRAELHGIATQTEGEPPLEDQHERELRDFNLRCERHSGRSHNPLVREIGGAALSLLRMFVVGSERLVWAFHKERRRRKMLQRSSRQLAGEFLDMAIRLQESVESNASMFDDDGQLNKQLVQELSDGAAQLWREFRDRSELLLLEFHSGSERFISKFCSQVILDRVLQESRQLATRLLVPVPEFHRVQNDGHPLKLLQAEIKRLVHMFEYITRVRPKIRTLPLWENACGHNCDARTGVGLWVVIAVGVNREKVQHAEDEAREFADLGDRHGLCDESRSFICTGGSKEDVLNTLKRGIAKLKLFRNAKLMIFVAGEGHATYDAGALLEASDSDPELSKTWVQVETEVLRMLQEQEIFKAEVVMFLSLCRVSFTPRRVDDVPDHIDEPLPTSPGIHCVKIYGCKWNRQLEDFSFIPRALEVFLVRGAADVSVLTTWMLPDLYWLTLRKVEMDVVEDCAPTPTHPIMFFAAPKRPWVPLQPPWNEEAIDDLCDSTFLLARHIGFLACHALEKHYLKARHDVLRIAERLRGLSSVQRVEDLNLGDLPRDVLEPMADALVKHVHEEEADVDPHQVVEEVRRLVDQLQQYLSVYTLQELCEDYEDYEEAQQHPQHLTAFVAMGVSSRSAPEPPERRQEMAHEIFRLADKYKIPVDRFYIGPGSLWILLQSAVPLPRESLLRFGEDLSKCFQQYAKTSLRWRRASPFKRAPLPSVPGDRARLKAHVLGRANYQARL